MTTCANSDGTQCSRIVTHARTIKGKGKGKRGFV